MSNSTTGVGLSEDQYAIVIARRRREVTSLYVQGKTQAEIAEVVRVSQQQVSRDLEVIRAEWLRCAKLDMDAIKSRELARIEEVEREYWEAWQRSKREITRRSRSYVEGARKGEKAEGVPVQVTETVEETSGDPRYLAGVQKCIADRCAILGLYAPKLVDVGVTPLKVVGGVDMDAV